MKIARNSTQKGTKFGKNERNTAINSEDIPSGFTSAKVKKS